MAHPSDIDDLWRQTLGAGGWESLDPGATCLPSDTLAPDLLDEMDSAPPRSREGEAVGLSLGGGSLKLGGVIGEGGVGRVFRAVQGSLHREVAVKIVREPSGERAFLNEARISGAIDHPNVLPVHDLVGSSETGPALVMKWVRGRSWLERLDAAHRDGMLNLISEMRTLLAVCQGVAAAHAHGVLHLDLKPANVLIGEYGEVFITDWGCAVVGDRDPRWADQPALPRPSAITAPFGTPAYMPPELARGEGDALGPWTDVYLLGGLLYEVVAGHPPRKGWTTKRIVEDAIDGRVDPLPETVEPGLRAILDAALAPSPEDRPQTAAAFRDAVAHWLDTRESRRIASDAARSLARVEARLAGVPLVADPDEGDDEGPEERLFEIAGALQQARVLWPENDAAAQAEHRARRLLASLALDRGEPGLALAQARRLPDDDPERAAILLRAAEVTATREAQRRQTRWLRWGIGGAVAVAVSTGLVAIVLIDSARQQAELAAGLAADRLDQVLRLSDQQRLRELEVQAEELWPAVPEREASLQQWIDEAQDLLSDRTLHVRALADMPPERAGEPLAQRWRRELLTSLIAGMDALEADLLPSVTRRLETARTLHQRSIDDHAETWEEVRRAVLADPRFGLDLAPQLGLVPLGPDPDSGLQEFAHLLTGAAPTRGPDGRLAPAEGDGVVLVLVPGGRAWIGAAVGDPVHPDPKAALHEGPVHQVQLDPYFIGKYEWTQDQWLRARGKNSSAYPIGREVAGRVIGPTHPAEQVGYDKALRILARVGLTLPTEAQWEAAARAGGRTIYPTGDAIDSLQGYANLADRWARDNGGPASWRYESALDDGWLTHAPVGSFRPNPWGLHDMTGNVWEWCLDPYGAYTLPTAPGTGARLAPDDAPRVFRGGGFRSNGAHARSADRYSLYSADFKGFDVGLRVARAVR